MAKYLDSNGLLYFWQKIKSYVAGEVPTGASADNSATGITIADHGTSTIYGVSSSTTTASHVKSGGNGSAPSLGTAFSVPNVTAVGSGSFSATVSAHVLSFSHGHSAPTLGTAFSIPNVTSVGSASNWAFEDITVPKKDASSTTVVTGKTHSITDSGHTHTVSFT